jgi:hypothetical protein
MLSSGCPAATEQAAAPWPALSTCPDLRARLDTESYLSKSLPSSLDTKSTLGLAIGRNVVLGPTAPVCLERTAAGVPAKQAVARQRLPLGPRHHRWPDRHHRWPAEGTQLHAGRGARLAGDQEAVARDGGGQGGAEGQGGARAGGARRGAAGRPPALGRARAQLGQQGAMWTTRRATAASTPATSS